MKSCDQHIFFYLIYNTTPLNVKKVYDADLKRISILGAPCKNISIASFFYPSYL